MFTFAVCVSVLLCVQCKYCVLSRSGVCLGADEGTSPLKVATHFGEVRLSCGWGSSQLQELQENKRPSSSRPDDLYIRYEREIERDYIRDDTGMVTNISAVLLVKGCMNTLVLLVVGGGRIKTSSWCICGKWPEGNHSRESLKDEGMSTGA